MSHQYSRIIDIRHPYWYLMDAKWRKWRLAYCGGDEFGDAYIKKFSQIEDGHDYINRKAVTPSPSFAKSAINEVKNSIFQRMADVTRRGGTKSYQEAVQGKNNGVDLHGKTMNQYIGTEVIPELLTMARVGIFVDMPPVQGPTLADQQGMRPYIYTYKTEDICSWSWRKDKVNEFQSVLLRDYVDDCSEQFNLPMGTWSRWRYIYISPEDGKVHVRCYDDDCHQVTLDGDKDEMAEYILDINFIPLVILEITDSLMADIANHQVALVNLESSDIAYALKSNVPVYVEQANMIEMLPGLRGPGPNGEAAGTEGTSEEAATSKDKSIKIGHFGGRRYGHGLNQPAFIHPSPEPLLASMQKQKNLKDDIRQLINLALSNIKPKMASAESKAIDERGLEAGLSAVGLVLEHAENKITTYWSAYERSKEIATVSYPKNYSLQTEEDRRKEVESLEELRDSLPSVTFQKAVSKRMADVLLGGKESVEVLDKIKKEIDAAETITASIERVIELVNAGICSKELAAKIFGFPEGTVLKADEEHANRAAAIAKAQSEVANDSENQNAAARGNPDMSADPKGDAAAEKAQSRDTTMNTSTAKPVRGEGK